jgi:hypothetical protein
MSATVCPVCGAEHERKKYCGSLCAFKAHRAQQAAYQMRREIKLNGPFKRCFRCKEPAGPREAGNGGQGAGCA